MKLSLRFPKLLSLCGIGLALAGAAPGQSIVEYGHAAAGSAHAASGLRGASPAATFERVGRSLQGGTQGRARAAARPGLPHSLSKLSALGEPLTVVRVDWGARDELQKPVAETLSQTLDKKNVLAEAATEEGREGRLALEARGLRRGMNIQEVLMLLGDPDVRATGLDGSGYDEKLLFRMPTGWRVVVFGARGRVQAFIPSSGPQKTTDLPLQSADSVIP